MDIEVQEEKPDSQEEETPEKKPKNLFREFLEMVIYVIGVALAAFFLYHYVVQ